MARIASYRESEERYPILRIVGVVFAVVGTASMAAGALLLAFGLYNLLAGATPMQPRGGDLFSPRPASSPFLALGGALSVAWAFGLLVSGLQFLAVGTLFRLAIHVEENTRASAQSLAKLHHGPEFQADPIATIFRS